MKPKSIVVIGTGYWGKNLVRNFSELGVLLGIYDVTQDNIDKMKESFHVDQVYSSLDEIWKDDGVKGVAIATPAATHYEMAKAAILAGKDVFVEKPLALEVSEAEELIQLAQENNRILMVDHLLQYHGAVIKLKEIIDNGKLGKLQYIYSNRLNIGKLRSEENILWSFAPHDISVILELVQQQPLKVSAFGEAFLQDDIYDTTLTDLSFEHRIKAHIYVSWLHPFKEQKLVVIGSQGMAVFNDMEQEEKLVVYPHKVEWIKQVPVASKAQKEVIAFEKTEPLKEACQHFLTCMDTRQKAKTDGNEALAVLKVLQQAQEYLDKENNHDL
ncbi:MAG: Gfo/Idh/MocA family oxidoreductase [Candidatus Omnitrophica bacterium]|nr:Gfo/Idh/MocA family oxidoreductase [Candidatus Omnitrophota bacterium]